jgi:hypothetical protein
VPDVVCPGCRGNIASEDVNMREGVAMCRGCSRLFKVSELAEDSELADVEVAQAPRGCEIQDDGVQTTLVASHRSIPGAIGALFFGLFWNGIVSVFLLMNIASTLQHLGVSLPTWFPAPKMNGGSVPLGMTLFLWVFLTPFLLVGGLVIVWFLMSLGGKVEVRVRGGEGVIFTGIGAIGYRRRFDAGRVARVGLKHKRDSEGATSSTILLSADQEITFGGNLPKERKRWLAAAARHVLMPGSQAKRPRVSHV